MARLIEKLPPYLATLGLFGLLVALGLYQYGNGLDRYAPAVAVVSVALLIYYVIERPREVVQALSGRTVRYGGNALAMSLAFIAIVVLINVLAARFSYRVDLTETKDFTLSEQTVQLLKELKQPVKLTAFYREGQGKEGVQDVVKQFQQHTANVEFEFVDPDLKPGVARQLGVEFAGQTVVQSNDKKHILFGSSEGDLISGIIKVTRDSTKKVYFVVGHGEADPESADQGGASSAKQMLEAEGYAVEPLNVVATGKVPDDASVVVIAGPTSPLRPEEATALNAYLDAGGKALLLADPSRQAGLAEIADRFGVEIGKGIVVEFGQSLPNEPLVPIVAGRGYLQSPITQSLPTMTILPTATEVKAKKLEPGKTAAFTVASFAQTTERSWLKAEIKNNQVAPEAGVDPQGPLSVAATAITAGAEQAGTSADGNRPKSTRLVVIGDVDFAINQFLNWEGNRDFLMNSVNWLAEDEDMIGVRAKVPANRSLMLTNSQLSLALYSSVFVLPLAVLAVGAWVVWGRRSRA